MKIINIINKMYSVLSPMPAFNSWKGRGTVVFWYRAGKVRDGFQYGEIIKGYCLSPLWGFLFNDNK